MLSVTSDFRFLSVPEGKYSQTPKGVFYFSFLIGL